MNAQELQAKIENLAGDQGYPYFALCRQYVGKPDAINTVGHFKPSKTPGNASLFVSELAPYVHKYPGYYVLYYRRTPKAPWQTLAIDTRPEEERTEIKLSENQQTPPIMIDDRTEKHLMQIAELMAENARLNEVNNGLKSKIAELEEEIEAMTADAEETQHATMADQTVSMVGQVAQILPAVLDKWFSLQEQKNALLAEQMRRSAPQPRPQAPQQNVNNMYHEEAGY